MRKFESMKKVLSFLMAVSMVLQFLPISALAETDCAHHEHGESCGYREAVPCGFRHRANCRYETVVANCVHIHGEGDCTYMAAREAVFCHPEHNDDCGYGADTSCNVTHEDCICAEAVPESGVCNHVCNSDAGCDVSENHICAHTVCDETCGYAEQAACTFVCDVCDVCEMDDDGNTGSEEDAEESISVDFMEYLEDPILLAFQSDAAIDLHDWLVNAYGVPEEIPFTCEPASVAYGQYADGTEISVSVTAGEGYEGSCTVNAEVRYLVQLGNPKVTFSGGDTLNVGDTITVTVNEVYDSAINFEGEWLDKGESVTLTAPDQSHWTLKVWFTADKGKNFGNGWVEEPYPESYVSKAYYAKYQTYFIKNRTAMPDKAGRSFFSNSLNYTYNGQWHSFELKSGWNMDSDHTDKYYYKYNYEIVKQPGGSNGYGNPAKIEGNHLKAYNAGTYKLKATMSASDYAGYIGTIQEGNGWKKENDQWVHYSEAVVNQASPAATVTFDANKTSVTYGDVLNHRDFATVQVTGVQGEDLTAYYDFNGEWRADYLSYNGNYEWSQGLGSEITATGKYKPSTVDRDVRAYVLRAIKATVNDNATDVIRNNYTEAELTGYQKYSLQKKNITVGYDPAKLTKTYDGQPMTVDSGSLWLQYPDGSKVADSDYTLSFGSELCNAGTYLPRFALLEELANTAQLSAVPDGAKVVIKPRSIENAVVVVEETQTYNGSPLEPEVTVTLDDFGALASGMDFTLQYADNENVGTATVTVTGKGNFTGTASAMFTIVKKPVTVNAITAGKVYDGTPALDNPVIELNGIEAMDQVSAVSRGQFENADAGVNKPVTVTEVRLTGQEAGNYLLVDDHGDPVTEDTELHASGTIHPRPVTIEPVAAQKKIYGEKDPAELFWEITEGSMVADQTLTGIRASRESGENVGTYEIKLTEVADANPNYAVTLKSGSFVIEKKTLTVDVLVRKQFDNTTAVDKNRDTFLAELQGIVGNDRVELNSMAVSAEFVYAEVGNAIAVTLTGDFAVEGEDTTLANYELQQPSGVTGEIYNDYTATVTVDPESWTNEQVTVYAPENCQVSLSYDHWADTVELTDITESKDGNKKNIYVRNAEGDISLPVEVAYFIEKTVPTGNITIGDLAGWHGLVNSITFNLFYKDMQSVTITADDELAGIKTVEYLESRTAMTQEKLKDADWTVYNGSVNVSLEDAKQFIYYAKITDNAGNVTYLSTDGAEYDTTAPAVSIDTGIFYTTQSVTVSDKNFASVTLDGTSADTTMTLAGDQAHVYTIAAKDKAGNETIVTVTMRPIASLSADLPTEETVKLSDKRAVEQVKEKASDAFTAHTTEAEKKQLEAIIAQCDLLLECIEKAESVIALINAMPEVSRAQPDNKTHIGAYEAAVTAYSDPNLPASSKRMVGKENAAKLDAVLKALTDYDIVKQSAKYYVKGSHKKLTFTANGYFGKFTGIEVDGKTVDAQYYKAESGSTIVTLKSSYLEQLDTGEHAIRILYTDGGTDGKDFFRIHVNNGNPFTGDDTHMLLFSSLSITSLLGLALLMILLPRSKGRYER